MGMKAILDSIYLSKKFAVATVATGTVFVTGTLWTITGGLVRIHGIYCYCLHSLDDAAGGTTFLVTVNGVACNNPAYAVAPTIAGDILVFPLGAFAVVAAPANQSPNVAALTAFSGMSLVAGPINGLIVLTVGIAALVAGELSRFVCVYEKIDPQASIA